MMGIPVPYNYGRLGVNPNLVTIPVPPISQNDMIYMDSEQMDYMSGERRDYMES